MKIEIIMSVFEGKLQNKDKIPITLNDISILINISFF